MKDLIDKIKEDLPLTQEERLLAMSALSTCEALQLKVEYGVFELPSRLMDAINGEFAVYGEFRGNPWIRKIKAKDEADALAKANEIVGWKFTYAEEL